MMKYLKSYLAFIFAILSFVASSTAFATTIQATVSKNKVVKNEVFQLKVVVDQKVSSDDIDFSVLEKDFYLGRPSFGTSINIINGKRTSHSEWNISIAAQRIGISTIPAFTVDGASSQPIAIQVGVDNEQPNVSDLVEVQSHLNKTQLYPNESALLKTRLIIKADPRRLQNPQIIPPIAQGLTLAAVGDASQYQSAMDGMEVTVVDQDFRVTADQAGEFTVSGIGFKGSVVYGNNRSGTTRLIDASTPAEQFKLVVHPIPENYQGNWLPASKLELNQHWTDSSGKPIAGARYETKVGESITREITLDIDGITAERFPNISVNYPSSIRIYQEKPQFSDLGKGTTRMTLTQVLIPQLEGEIALNDISINWWSSKEKQQQTATIKGLILSVAAGEALNGSEPLVLNSLPSSAETITVKDSGFWPYLTALFATLWLITLLFLFKARSAKTQHKHKTKVPSRKSEALIHALSKGDVVQASFLGKQWLSETQFSDEQLKQQVKDELDAMNASVYATEKRHWDNKKLIKLVKKLDKSTKVKPSSEPLEPL
ncbi:BatD family protein [Vibrio hepatarius]|nr:BatD family protein [Vibrio hepatarius]